MPFFCLAKPNDRGLEGSREIPICQVQNKRFGLVIRHWCLEFIWNLGFDIWDLSASIKVQWLREG
jgi:hypothetical protein